MRKFILGGLAALSVGVGVLTATPAHAEEMFACGNATYVNQNTTCPFAHNVTDAWFASPSNQIGAWSDAIGRVVIMDCAYVNIGYGSGEVCRGGNNAVVVFHP
jgi:hypothetical protein